MKTKNNVLRGPLMPDFLADALQVHPDAVVFVADAAHRLEYSFGIDVLKHKPLIREYIAKAAALGICCGVETDFRHENILHAGDCGADFVEIDVDNYLEYREHYILGIEIANERGIGVWIKGHGVDSFVADMPGNICINNVTKIYNNYENN